MALFLINICKYDGCGITFPNLNDLIRHIEGTHIDYDPKVVEQKEKTHPACLPLSYVLRFISEDARQGGAIVATNATGVDLKRKLAIKHHSYSISSSNRSNTPTGSEMDEDEMVATESEDSNDSWTTEEFSSEFIMRYGSRHSGTGITGAPGNEKPFACPVPGCKKRYKNVNGIKYHSKNGHKKDGKVRKGYKCHCGKSYKTAQGLKNHALVSHNSAENLLLQSNPGHSGNSGMHIQRSSSPSQSLGSLSPSSISNMSSSASSCQSVSNNTHNGGNGLLQHLGSNSLASASTASFITTTTTNGGVILQQQAQQHFSINSISSSNNHLQHVTPAPTTESRCYNKVHTARFPPPFRLSEPAQREKKLELDIRMTDMCYEYYSTASSTDPVPALTRMASTSSPPDSALFSPRPAVLSDNQLSYSRFAARVSSRAANIIL